MNKKNVEFTKTLNEMSNLYELSLAVGYSLDLRENCDFFAKALMARFSLGFCSVCVNSKYLHGKEDDGTGEIVYAHPEYYVEENCQCKFYSNYTQIMEKSFAIIKAYEDESFLKKNISQGSIIIIKLGDVGFLKLFSIKEDYFNDIFFNKLKNVIDNFEHSLEGCLAYMRMKREINERKKAEAKLNFIKSQLEKLIEVRTEELQKINNNLQKEIVERINTEEKIRKQNAYLTSLHETALGLLNRLEVSELLQNVVVRAGELVGTSHGYIFIFDKEKKIFERKVGIGIYEADIGRKIKLGEGLVSEVWEKGKPVFIRDYKNWENRLSHAFFGDIFGVLQVPLKIGNEVFGTVGLAFINEERDFGKEETSILVRFAELASIAIDNARLFTSAQQELNERKKIELALRKSKDRLRAILDVIPDAIFRLTKEGEIQDFKPGNKPVFFAPRKGINISEFLPKKIVSKLMYYVNEALRTGKMQTYEEKVEEKVEKKTEFIFSEFRIVASSEDEVVAIVRDVTERKELEERLKFLSLRDALTGLYNRTFFQQEMLNMEIKNKSVGIVICDVDGLKLVNDTFGHNMGDEMLKATAQILNEVFNERGMVARIGGDEYAVLLENSSEDELNQQCSAIEKRIREYNNKNGMVPLSISIGFAFRTDCFVSIRDLFKEADDNMYREKLHRSQSNRSAIVQTLMKALEARDFITEGHADRMQDLISELALAAGIQENKISDLKLLAKFHDIGKVGIPDKILFKPGALTREEAKVMQRHSEIGFRIAQSSADLGVIADWILKHHEWWNGSGYPLGLTKKEIPLECRILSIVDAFDAMTSNRPYRPAMTMEKAINELKRFAGIQFDPELVKIFININKSNINV